MSILDKTFTGIKKVIKCLILSCFYVNILYVSVVLAKPPHVWVLNALQNVIKNFEENPRMLIPGGSMLLINYDKSESISQDTEPIEQILQPLYTGLSDQSIDSLVEINDNSDNLFPSLDSTNTPSESVISQDTESVIPIHSHSNVNTMSPPVEGAVQEEPIVPKRASVLAAAGRVDGDARAGETGGADRGVDGDARAGETGGADRGVDGDARVGETGGADVDGDARAGEIGGADGGVDGDARVGETGGADGGVDGDVRTGKTGEADVDGDVGGGTGGVPPPSETVVSEEKDTSEVKATPEKAATPVDKATPEGEAASPQPEAAVITTTNTDDIVLLQKEIIRNIALAVNEIVILSYEFANSTIDLRLTNLRYLNNLTVLSSGDDVNIGPKNLWISGTIGKAKYNGKSMLNGYTGKISAVTIGEDIELPSGSIIGGAYNYVLSNFKYKNRINKIVVHTHVMSIYGQTNLSKKVILQGFLSLALGNVSTKLSAYNQLVKAKFADTSYSSKAIIAYNSRISRVLIVPYIGFKYGRYNIARYNASFKTQSLLVAASNGRRTSGLIGFGVIMPMNVNNTSQMVPGLYMEVEKFLHNKQKNLHMRIESYRFNNREEVLLLEEAAKYQYKIGGTITIKCQLAEIMAAYEYLVFNNKYSHHQGSLKLKLLF